MLLAAATEADKLNLDISLGTWAILGAVIVVMLAFDLFVYARGHIPSVRENLLWSIGWILVALAFGAVFWAWQGSEAGSQYLAGYLLERSLSLDNIFVFAVILAYFAVPGEKVQGKVLAWGIMLALFLRLIFIMLGAALLDAFHVTFYVFGALLLYTAWKLARHDDVEVDPEHNPLLKQLRKRVTITDEYDGDKLFTKVNGKRVATPLLAVFIVIASTDIIFAVDSIPAIFAVTQEPFIVFAANAFALIGLRALVLPARRPDGPLRLPDAGAVGDPRVHRREDAPDRHLARTDLALAGRDRGHAGDHRGALAAGGAEGQDARVAPSSVCAPKFATTRRRP